VSLDDTVGDGNKPVPPAGGEGVEYRSGFPAGCPAGVGEADAQLTIGHFRADGRVPPSGIAPGVEPD
jgi:hypothetical protein